MKMGSLYSGYCDGFSLAAQQLGIQVPWHVEKDIRAHKYLKNNYPESKLYRLDTDVGKHNLEWTHIITGGDPCQPHSYAGVRKGRADDRYRWPEMFRIVSEMRPNWIINENVVGTISNMVLDKKIADLESAGYTCQAYNLPACAVNADHERQRIFLVAHTNVFGRKEPLCDHVEAFTTEDRQAITLGTQGNSFLQFYNLKRGFINPRFSLFLMGFPIQWLDLEELGTQLSLNLPTSSLK